MDVISYLATSWVALIITGVLWMVWWCKKPHSNFPPGPIGVPLLGVLPFLGNHPQEQFRLWSLKYGPIMSVRIAGRDVVFLNTFDAINAALVKQEKIFSGRPTIDFYNQVLRKNGITYLDYSRKFKESKKFALTSLKRLGFGRRKAEDVIIKETNLFMKNLVQKQNTPINLQTELVDVLCNIISILIIGKRFDYNDPAMKTILKHGASKPGDSKLQNLLIHFYKYLKLLPPFRDANKRFINGEKKAADALRSFIEEHKLNSENDSESDFVSMYLRRQEEVAAGRQNDIFTNEHLEGCIRDIIIAGTENPIYLLRWLILCVLSYPKYHEMIVNEIDNIIGKEESPRWEHLQNMPITYAFLQEVWRYCPSVPNAVLHRTLSNTQLGGFHIPKNTHVSPNIYAAHFDPNIWRNPVKFDPLRHIDKDGKFIRSFRIIPCCIGPRFCLGRDIAYVEEFIIFASLLKKFRVSSPSPLPPINSGVTTAAYVPHSYEVTISLRD